MSGHTYTCVPPPEISVTRAIMLGRLYITNPGKSPLSSVAGQFTVVNCFSFQNEK